MLVDYHNHTPLCAHADGEPIEYVQRAIDLDIAEIGFAEHSPWMIQRPGEKLAPTDQEFADYVATIQALKSRFNAPRSSPIRVRLGIEMDYVPDRMARVRHYLSKYPWDYVIGSVHHLDSWGFDNPTQVDEFEKRDIAEVYSEYFDKVIEMAETGLFDIVGHVDLIKKFGYRPEGDLTDLYRQVARRLKRAGVVVEFNTSGLDKQAREFYPSPQLLEALVAENVPLTLGSDAHKPTEVGRYLAEARAMLLDLGVTRIVAFENRNRRPVAL